MLTFYFSGGGSATSVLGGEISSTQLTETQGVLFPDITQAQATSGITQYASIYIKNTGASTITNPGVYFYSLITAGNVYVAAGITPNLTIANQTTAPTDELIFTKPLDAPMPLRIGSLNAGSSKQLWLKRVIAANSTGAVLDYGILTGVEV